MTKGNVCAIAYEKGIVGYVRNPHPQLWFLTQSFPTLRVVALWRIKNK